MPERRRGIAELNGKQISFGAMAGTAGNARANAFAGAIIADFKLSFRVEWARAKNHRAVDVDRHGVPPHDDLLAR